MGSINGNGSNRQTIPLTIPLSDGRHHHHGDIDRAKRDERNLKRRCDRQEAKTNHTLLYRNDNTGIRRLYRLDTSPLNAIDLDKHARQLGLIPSDPCHFCGRHVGERRPDEFFLSYGDEPVCHECASGLGCKL